MSFSQLRQWCEQTPPGWFIVLGSGLGMLTSRVDTILTVAFQDIPGLPVSTVAGHRGRWTLGRWREQIVLLSEGRLHYYEGHPWEMVVRPVEIAASLGVRRLLLTNAAGGIREDLLPGTLMPISDQIEWNLPAPWNQEKQPSPYQDKLLQTILKAGNDLEMNLQPGVYASVRGPSYETPAEIRALRSVGADAVGMSTSREASRGAELGLQVAGISLITNRAAGLGDGKLHHEEVLAAGKAAANDLANLVERVLTLTRQDQRLQEETSA